MRERNKKVLGLCILFLTLGIPAFATPIDPVDLGNGWTATYDDAISMNLVGITKFQPGYCEIDKIFVGSFTPITITFTRTGSSNNSPNTIVIRDEYVENQTGVTWTDYHISLESDNNNTLVAFDASQGVPNALNYNEDSVAFDPVTFDNYAGLKTGPTTRGPLAINFYGGALASGSAFQISPDGIGPKMTIKIDPSCNTFTLSQVPTPEPATLIFLVVGLVGMNKLRSRVNPSSIKALVVLMAFGFVLFMSGSSAQAGWINLTDTFGNNVGWSANVPEITKPEQATISKVTIDGTKMIFEIVKTFTGAPTDNQWGPLLISFRKDLATSPIKSFLIKETVYNQTTSTSAWDIYGMAIQLNPSVKFMTLPSMPDQFSSMNFKTSAQTEIDFNGGNVPQFTSFTVDKINIDVSGVTKDGSFKLKEWPMIPEPVSLVLLATGGLALIRRKR
jgi:hypothetical protein